MLSPPSPSAPNLERLSKFEKNSISNSLLQPKSLSLIESLSQNNISSLDSYNINGNGDTGVLTPSGFYQSKRKSQIIGKTRPAWLPPKAPSEEQEHLKQFEKMLTLSIKSDKLKLKKNLLRKNQSLIQKNNDFKIWENKYLNMIKNNNFYFDPERINEWKILIWHGIPIQNRLIVWKWIIKNDLKFSNLNFKELKIEIKNLLKNLNEFNEKKFQYEKNKIINNNEKEIDSRKIKFQLYQLKQKWNKILLTKKIQNQINDDLLKFDLSNYHYHNSNLYDIIYNLSLLIVFYSDDLTNQFIEKKINIVSLVSIFVLNSDKNFDKNFDNDNDNDNDNEYEYEYNIFISILNFLNLGIWNYFYKQQQSSSSTILNYFDKSLIKILKKNQLINLLNHFDKIGLDLNIYIGYIWSGLFHGIVSLSISSRLMDICLGLKKINYKNYLDGNKDDEIIIDSNIIISILTTILIRLEFRLYGSFEECINVLMNINDTKNLYIEDEDDFIKQVLEVFLNI